MNEIINRLWNDPVYSGIALSILTWLGGKVWGFISDGREADLATMERWAEKAAAWAMVHFPNLPATELVVRGMEELRPILRNAGFNPSDEQWTHLSQVVGDFVARQLLARKNPATGNHP